MANKTAICTTSMGSFTIELYTNDMPITSYNFIDLVKNKFYDGLHIHRCVSDFVIQMGCPHSKTIHCNNVGSGAPEPNSTYEIPGNKTITRNDAGNIPDEFLDDACPKHSNLPFTISMANIGQPESGGSQIFINTTDNSIMDFFNNSAPVQHPVFGKVISGTDVIMNIVNVPVAKTSYLPITPIEIISIVMNED